MYSSGRIFRKTFVYKNNEQWKFEQSLSRSSSLACILVKPISLLDIKDVRKSRKKTWRKKAWQTLNEIKKTIFDNYVFSLSDSPAVHFIKGRLKMWIQVFKWNQLCQSQIYFFQFYDMKCKVIFMFKFYSSVGVVYFHIFSGHNKWRKRR
jgi:hypothetical protein